MRKKGKRRPRSELGEKGGDGESSRRDQERLGPPPTGAFQPFAEFFGAEPVFLGAVGFNRKGGADAAHQRATLDVEPLNEAREEAPAVGVARPRGIEDSFCLYERDVYLFACRMDP